MESIRILLAEDNPVNQFLARRLLENRGFQVSVASSGSEAIEMIAHHVYDIILMDISMPIMDGIDATRRIRELGVQVRGKDIPILALSAHSSPDDLAQYTAAGMNGFIPKPIEKEELFRIVDDALGV
ncbi:response regulator [Desulfovibrio inopinatus]|uniref:response regulator n=1 Tax=Desulfovibrio inopinatus TaxID=102109 RepID=UPI0004145BA2|nr:response regulator [Desulfovibrio inopinatus]